MAVMLGAWCRMPVRMSSRCGGLPLDDDSGDCDDDDNDEDNEDDVDGWGRRLRYSKYFDDFFTCVRAVRPFDADDKGYREQRALELFNAGSQMRRNLLDLRGTFKSSCPHVLTNIVTRQMVEDGDPNRRTCEQSEAIGVNLKFDLHRRCSRKRKLGASARTHCLWGCGEAMDSEANSKPSHASVSLVMCTRVLASRPH
eukprot:2083501-Pleurochrysis_carterae.AAC.8